MDIYDQNELRVRELAQQYNLCYFKNFTQMLVENKPDAVYILILLLQTQAILAIQALEVGLHVFVEKLFCLILEESDVIYAAAQSAWRLIGVDHNLLC